MRAFNIGCGPDIFQNGYMGYEQWRNVDSVYRHPEVENIDIRYKSPIADNYDFVLVNHTLCLLTYEEVDSALINLSNVLRRGGVIEVIDMDVLKAIDNLQNCEREGFAGHDGHIEEMFCKHLVGYGRQSLYTPSTMGEKLKKAGFHNIKILESSQYDLRPKESLIVQGTK